MANHIYLEHKTPRGVAHENVPETFDRPLNIGDTYEEREALDQEPRRVFRITGPARHVTVKRSCISYYPAEIVS